MSSLESECDLCNNETEHICEFNQNSINQLTDEMKKFGIIGKIIQPKPKVDGEEKKFLSGQLDIFMTLQMRFGDSILHLCLNLNKVV